MEAVRQPQLPSLPHGRQELQPQQPTWSVVVVAQKQRESSQMYQQRLREAPTLQVTVDAMSKHLQPLQGERTQE